MASRSKKKPAEEETKGVEDEKAIFGPTKGRKLEAVNKAKLVEDPVPVDSPRTPRAKKGNFNKYGNDFLIEQGKKGEKKRVQFEEEKHSNTGTRRVGRNTKKVAEKEAENEDKKMTEPVKSTRAKKQTASAKVDAHEDKEGENQITEVKNTRKKAGETIHMQDGVEMVSSKLTRGRKRPGKVTDQLEDSEKEESESTEVDDTEVAVAKPARGKKQFKKMASRIEDSEEEESKLIEVDDGEMVSSKLTKNRKQLGKATNKLRDNEKGETGPTEVDDTEIVSAKPTRGKKRPGKTANKVEGKEEVDEAKDVEDEKAIIGPTEGRKLKAVDKVKLVEDPVPVDSPRMPRAKKGNFNKYGNDFLIEQGKKRGQITNEKVDMLIKSRKLKGL